MGFDNQLLPPFRDVPEAGGLSGLLFSLTLSLGLSPSLGFASSSLNLIHNSFVHVREGTIVTKSTATWAQVLVTPHADGRLLILAFPVPRWGLGSGTGGAGLDQLRLLLVADDDMLKFTVFPLSPFCNCHDYGSSKSP